MSVSAGASLTVDTTATCGALTYAAVTSNTTVTISGSNTLTVTGAITMPRPSTSMNATLAIGAGSVSCGSLTMSATTPSSSAREDIITISTGSLTINGNVTCGTTACLITFSGAGTLTMAGTGTAFSSSLAFTASTSTVNYTGAGAQTMGAFTYNNLTLGGSGAKTFPSGTTTVNGILSMEGTATATVTGTLTYGSAATLQYNGSGAQTTGAEFPATFIPSGGVIIANTSGSSVTFAASKTVNSRLTINTSAKANLGANNHIAINLTLGGVSQANGTYGSSSSIATNQNDTYFDTAGTGVLTAGIVATRLLVTLPGQTFTSGSGNSGTVSGQTAGTSFNITLSAVDAGNNLDTSYSGAQTVSYAGPGNAPGGASPTYTTSVTFASGQATGLATTLVKAETVAITPTISGLTGVASSNVTVAGGAVSAAQSTVSASPGSIPADGLTGSTVTVTLKDANGNGVSGKTVTLASDRGATDTISAASGTSSAAGVVTFTVKSSTVGSPVFSATDTTDSVPITPSTATVTFTTPTGIALRGIASATTTGTSLTINTPTGVVDGDVMIVSISQSGTAAGSQVVPTCTGWTAIDGRVLRTSSPYNYGAVLYKVAASEGASYTFTLGTATTSAVGAISAYSGVNPVSPFDVTPGTITANTGGSTAVTATAITTVSANTLILMCGMSGGTATWNNGAWSTATSPGALTELYDTQATAASIGAAAAFKAAGRRHGCWSRNAVGQQPKWRDFAGVEAGSVLHNHSLGRL